MDVRRGERLRERLAGLVREERHAICVEAIRECLLHAALSVGDC